MAINKINLTCGKSIGDNQQIKIEDIETICKFIGVIILPHQIKSAFDASTYKLNNQY
jgi:hypothetical protein